MKKTTLTLGALLLIAVSSCSVYKNDPFKGQRIEPTVITDKTNHDTDDPAIWIHPERYDQSLIVGTDKDTDGGLFVYDLNGKLQNKVLGLKRPNNVDIQYGLPFQGKKVDIAVVTERELNQIRIYSLPEMTEIGVVPVFEGEALRAPMGIALYKNPTSDKIYAIVGRKEGPSGTYLWQYELKEQDGKISGEVVRKFGEFSGKKEIEAIAVDHELGYVYYSDEQSGIHKYYADPEKSNESLAVFGQNDFKEDMEGISIYTQNGGKGYILVSNQQAGTFNVYPREGSSSNPHDHQLIVEIPVSTKFSDGSEVSSKALSIRYPKGLFVAMSEGKVFHYYDWRDLEAWIEKAKQTAP